MTDRAVLISTYELGRQPFGLAAPAALLRAAGAEVSLQDVSIHRLDERLVEGASFIACYLPMHTAARLAQDVVHRVRALNPTAHVCVYGLYAPLNEAHFRSLGADTVLGGECEERLVELFLETVGDGARPGGGEYRQDVPVVSLGHQGLRMPDRHGLPDLERYARIVMPTGERRVVGYTEASRGCRHRCRHCPIVPVYEGRFVPIPRSVVLADIDQQVAHGARHITFGDPDFFNGPAHSLRIVQDMHQAFPFLSYDVTIKIEHLKRHLGHLERLTATGCILVTSAVESFDSAILDRFDKGHTTEDVETVLGRCREIGLALNPTFVAFTPWTTVPGYLSFLDAVRRLDLVADVSPVQYAIRLLVTAGSRLLELSDVTALLHDFDQVALCYPWSHPHPAVDELWRRVVGIVAEGQAGSASRREIFDAVRRAAGGEAVVGASDPVPEPVTIPYLTEPWYC